MTRRTAKRTMKGLALIIVVLLSASACGGSDDTAEVDLTETSGSSAPETTETDGSIDDTGDDSDEPETLDDYLGTGFFTLDPEEQIANNVRQQQQVQELIAECMAREGFEYVPASPPVGDFRVGAPGDVEYAREQGFGISTYFGESGESEYLIDAWVDPNQAIVESLSESERDAYNETLYGSSFASGGFGFEGDSATATSSSEGGTVTEEVEAFDDGFEGCSGQAYEEVFAFDDLQEIYEQLDLDSLFQRVEADPRTAAIYAEWSQCMADQGYDYENPDVMYEAVYTDFQGRLMEIVGEPDAPPNPFEGMSDEEIAELFETLSPEELDDRFSQGQQTSQQDIDQEAIAALQAEERALAVANAECSGGLYEQFIELTKEYETALVNENRALLEQYRDRQEG